MKWNGLKETAALGVAVVAISAVLMMAAIAQQQDGGAEQATLDLGKQTYAQKCSHCHGPNMINSGTVTPDLRRFPDDRPRFVATVKQGKNGKMPPWGDILNDDDIGALWIYVASRRAP